MSSLQDGSVTVLVTDTNPEGYTLSQERKIQLLTAIPALSLDVPFVDYVVDEAEVTAATVSGRGTPGDTITVTIADEEGTFVQGSASVDSTGRWTIPVNVQTLEDGLLTVTVTSTDSVGNHATLISGGTKDSRNPFITIDPLLVSPITVAEVDSVPISGTAEAGSIVTVTIRDVNGKDIVLTTVASPQGVWNLDSDLSTLADGPVIISATAVDSSGNVVMAVPRSVMLTTKESPVPNPAPGPAPVPAPGPAPIPSDIRIFTPIAGDDKINAMEEESVLITGQAPAGLILTVSISDGHSSVNTRVLVPPSGIWETIVDVASLREGELTVKAAADDGGLASARVELVLTAPVVIIEQPIASDNVIDRSEDTNVPLIGSAPPGAVVTIRLVDSADNRIETTVTTSSSGVWSTTVNTSTLNNGEISVHASTVDENGNVGFDTAEVVQTPYGIRQDCEDLPAAHCGNQICDPRETSSSCPQDCSSAQCGDNVCSPAENNLICPADCASCASLSSCGNTVCEEHENSGSCPADCSAFPPCGNGVCDPEENAGSCSDCAVGGGSTCGNGQCDSQENGGNCPEDCAHDNPLTCRNGVCDVAENAGNCPEDCVRSSCNNNGVCDVYERSEECSDCDPNGLCNLNSVCDPSEHPASCSDCNDLPELRLRAFIDANLNGLYDAGEKLVEGAFFFLDLNRNGQLDVNEPLLSTLAQEDGDVSARLLMRKGDYDIGIIKSSLNALAIGYVSSPGKEIFSVSLRTSAMQHEQFVPLSRNLRPNAEPVRIRAPAGTTSIQLDDIITTTTDPNNNIDMTDGFEMLFFPDELADWTFFNGTLTILPLSYLTQSLDISYRLCDKEKLCSDPTTVSVDFDRPPRDPESPQPPPVVIVVTTPVPTPVLIPVPTPVPTPVRVPVFQHDDLDYDDYSFYSSSSSSASVLLVSVLATVLVPILISL